MIRTTSRSRAAKNRLHRLDPLLGSWVIRGRTKGSRSDNVRGNLKAEWLPSGILLQLQGEIRVGRFSARTLEIVGSDPSKGAFPAYVYSDLSESPFLYYWSIRGNTIRHEGGRAEFVGRFSQAGRLLTGGWRPKRGVRSSDANTYDVTMTKMD